MQTNFLFFLKVHEQGRALEEDRRDERELDPHPASWIIPSRLRSKACIPAPS
jgi:hypothetical protein